MSPGLPRTSPVPCRKVLVSDHGGEMVAKTHQNRHSHARSPRDQNDDTTCHPASRNPELEPDTKTKRLWLFDFASRAILCSPSHVRCHTSTPLSELREELCESFCTSGCICCVCVRDARAHFDDGRLQRGELHKPSARRAGVARAPTSIAFFQHAHLPHRSPPLSSHGIFLYLNGRGTLPS